MSGGLPRQPFEPTRRFVHLSYKYVYATINTSKSEAGWSQMKELFSAWRAKKLKSYAIIAVFMHVGVCVNTIPETKVVLSNVC